ncbi:MAG TPA: pepsin/retropepsin-like aspartic protease family protein [Sphingomicrobium sp.]
MIRSLLAAAVLATATAAAAEPLKVINGRLFIPAKINGVVTEALLDSGAEGSLFDPAFAAKAKFAEGTPQVMKGSGGTAPARIVEGVTIEALGVELHPEVVVVLDMSDLSTRLIKRPTQAIVGRELFDAARLRIDLAGGRIAVVSKAASPRGVKLPLTAHAGIEGIPVRANGVPAQAEFDLGNGSDVMISRDLVNRLKLPILGKKTGGGIGGAIERDYVLLPTLEVAGRRFTNVHANIDDQPSHNDMNVGTSILRNFRITTDFKERAVWLEPVAQSK